MLLFSAARCSGRLLRSTPTTCFIILLFYVALISNASHNALIKDNPSFLQRRYEVTAYDTDIAEVPLIRLIVRGDHHANPTPGQTSIKTTDSFKIVSGNVNDIFNISNTGLLSTTKPIGDVASENNGTFQLRVQLRQQAPNTNSFIDECTVIVHYVKINRHGPEWKLDSLISYIDENSKPGTFVTQLRCIDRDYEPTRHQVLSPSSSSRSNQHHSDHNLGQSYGNIKYFIKLNRSSVLETNEFLLDTISGNLTTRIPLDREIQDNYQLLVACQDNGKPEPLSSIVSLNIIIRDIDDNKPEFILPYSRSQRTIALDQQQAETGYDLKSHRPFVSFTVEEHQTKGLPVGEVKAIDKDLVPDNNPMRYCLIDGNDFLEFTLDQNNGILYTNQTLDRERQSSYELLVKAINDGSICEEHMISSSEQIQPASDTSSLQSLDAKEFKSKANDPNTNLSDYLLVKVEVLDINDNAPSFKRAVYRAGVHHKALINSLVTQVFANDPDNEINGTLNYKISDIFMHRSKPVSQPQHQSLAGPRGYRGHVIEGPSSSTNDLVKLVQFPFKIDQQGNIYTQQILTQYPVSCMFLINIEASEQTDPSRVAKTKLEVYIYEISNQLKMRVNLHPKIVEAYRSDIETLLSNATKYTAIINRARSYYGSHHDISALESSQATRTPSFDTNKKSKSPQQHLNIDELQKTSSNIHLIFVENYGIVNPNVIMEKFDLTSAQLFTPQLLAQMQHLSNDPTKASSLDQVRVNEVSSLIDKIALASVSASTEYAASSSSLAGIDWLESPSALIVSLGFMLFITGFLICIFGCCCKSRIKNHIIKCAMDKLVEQQNIQAKINERVLAATGSQLGGFGGTVNNQDFLTTQAGYISSFDATKGCANNNQDNMNILQRAIDSGEYIDPNYNTINGHYNMGAHFYDTSDMDHQHNAAVNGISVDGKQIDETNVSISLADESEGEDVEITNNGQLLNSHAKIDSFGNQRQRQQVPNNHK